MLQENVDFEHVRNPMAPIFFALESRVGVWDKLQYGNRFGRWVMAYNGARAELVFEIAKTYVESTRIFLYWILWGADFKHLRHRWRISPSYPQPLGDHLDAF